MTVKMENEIVKIVFFDFGGTIDLYPVNEGRFIRRIRPEMYEVMEELLETNLKFGIISNTVSLTQVPRNLIDYGIEKYFSPVISSSEFGKFKPDISIFHHAASAAGFLPEECIYVGNSLQKDIAPSKKAGYRAAIQIEYNDDLDKTVDLSIKPDFYIKSMKELPAIVRLLQDI
jgi:putative hydrolase of the HAD superfamily